MNGKIINTINGRINTINGRMYMRPDFRYKKYTHKLQWEDNVIIFTTRSWWETTGAFNGTLYKYFRKWGWIPWCAS